MAIILKNGSVFLHIPKTGGNWVTEVLYKSNLVKEKIGHKHATINQLCYPSIYRSTKLFKHFVVNRNFGIFARKKPFMFCFVRHPLSWYESWFKYMSQDNRKWQFWGDERDIRNWHPNAMLNGLGDSDFNGFVRNVANKRPGYVSELYGWYTTPEVDFIGKQENLREDLIRVLKLLELDFSEDFIWTYREVGVSQNTHQQVEWDPELRQRIYDLELAGLARYGYLERP